MTVAFDLAAVVVFLYVTIGICFPVISRSPPPLVEGAEHAYSREYAAVGGFALAATSFYLFSRYFSTLGDGLEL